MWKLFGVCHHVPSRVSFFECVAIIQDDEIVASVDEAGLLHDLSLSGHVRSVVAASEGVEGIVA